MELLRNDLRADNRRGVDDDSGRRDLGWIDAVGADDDIGNSEDRESGNFSQSAKVPGPAARESGSGQLRSLAILLQSRRWRAAIAYSIPRPAHSSAGCAILDRLALDIIGMVREFQGPKHD